MSNRKILNFKNRKLIIVFFISVLIFAGMSSFLQKHPSNFNWGILFYSNKGSPHLYKDVKIENLTSDMLILAVKGGICWASRGDTLFVSLDEGKSWKKKCSLPYNTMSLPYLKRFSILRNLFERPGIDKMKILDSGTVLVFSGKYLWHSTDGGYSFKVVHTTKYPPLLQGWVERNKDIFYGEYTWPNRERREVNLWESINDGKNWFIIYTFPAGSIRHIHAVQYDPYADRIWVTTGDNDAESKIMYSEDGAKTFKTIGQGTQEFRPVSLIFTADFVYWGTDCPDKQNYIFRWDRKTGKREAMQKIDGPAYYSTRLEDGSLVLATTVEKGARQLDASAHLWFKERNSEKWINIGSWKKIPGIASHGLLKLAQPNESSYIYLTPWYTEGHGFIFKLKVNKDRYN